MVKMNPFKEVIKALENHNVSYVIVGGFAAVIHGCNRFTADLDIIIDFNESNVDALIRAMHVVGFSPRLPIDPKELAINSKREEWQARNMQVFTFLKPNDPLFLLDVFIHHPIHFDSLFSSSNYYDFDEGKVRVCDIDNLIALKKLAGRAKDLQDIDDLMLIKAHKKA